MRSFPFAVVCSHGSYTYNVKILDNLVANTMKSYALLSEFIDIRKNENAWKMMAQFFKTINFNTFNVTLQSSGRVRIRSIDNKLTYVAFVC